MGVPRQSAEARGGDGGHRGRTRGTARSLPVPGGLCPPRGPSAVPGRPGPRAGTKRGIVLLLLPLLLPLLPLLLLLLVLLGLPLPGPALPPAALPPWGQDWTAGFVQFTHLSQAVTALIPPWLEIKRGK